MADIRDVIEHSQATGSGKPALFFFACKKSGVRADDRYATEMGLASMSAGVSRESNYIGTIADYDLE